MANLQKNINLNAPDDDSVHVANQMIEAVSYLITVADSNGLDGVVKHLTNARGKLVLTVAKAECDELWKTRN